MPDQSVPGQMSFGADMPPVVDPISAAITDPMGSMPMPQPEMSSEIYSTDFYSQPAVPSFAQQPEQTASLPVYPAQPYGAMATPTPAVRIIQTVSDETERPITFWQSVGFFLLLAIPLVGFIATIIFACSKGINRNLRNLSRGWLMLCLVPLLIVLIFLLASIMLTGDAFACVSQYTSA